QGLITIYVYSAVFGADIQAESPLVRNKYCHYVKKGTIISPFVLLVLFGNEYDLLKLKNPEFYPGLCVLYIFKHLKTVLFEDSKDSIFYIVPFSVKLLIDCNKVLITKNVIHAI